jgi:aromatic-L-amino-acid/L-tryptophan decarboxylase
MTQQVGTELLEIEKEELARMTSDVVALCEAYRTALRTTPVWKKQDHGVLKRVMKAGIPDESVSWSGTREIRSDILGSQAHVAHPRFLALVPSPNNAVSCLGDLLASAYNPFTGSWLEGSGAQSVERVVTEWLASEVGLPAGSSGIFLSGGSIRVRICCYDQARGTDRPQILHHQPPNDGSRH